MPWIEALLRGQRVFARAKADGSLSVDRGRVEIRYRFKDGRAYRAAAANLDISPGARLVSDDAFLGEAQAGPAAGAVEVGVIGPEEKRSLPRRAAAVQGWSAYADGACSGNPGPAGCGIVIVAPTGQRYEGFEYLGEATNNVAELMAVVRALEWMPPTVSNMAVHTDSQYTIGVLQKGWKAKANVDLVRLAKERVVARGAQLIYVPGHSGVALNERADELARRAVETRATRKAEVVVA